MPQSPVFRSLSLHLLFPAFLAIALFVIAIFVIIIPATEKSLLDQKREMITELTHSAWSLVESCYHQQENGELSPQEAREQAISLVNALRYGEEGKDYFWITDTRPFMVVHPYRADLNGQDLSHYTDPNGKRLFVEFTRIVQEQGAGYVDYWWQWKDDSTRIVPKLSYVIGFEPWDWIIGTGIYLEDVRLEISRITNRLIYISLLIILIISLILAYIVRQTLRIEKQKQQAEHALQVSREKYKSLVEASTEGTLMVLDNAIQFANLPLQTMLGYSESDLASLTPDELILLENEASTFTEILASPEILTGQLEAWLLKADGSRLEVLISLSHIDILGKAGYIVVARDMSSHKQIQMELGESKQRLQILTESINLGVFRINVGKTSHLTELNPAGYEILGIVNQSLSGLSFTSFFLDPEEAFEFYTTLMQNGKIRERIIQVRRGDGKNRYLSVSAIQVDDPRTHAKYIDGIFEDISEMVKTEQVRDEIITELNTSLIYLNQPIKHFAQYYPKIPMYQSIKNTAREMKKYSAGAGLVVSDNGDVVGIVSNQDFWKRVISEDKPLTAPVYEIMSAPVFSLSENALMFEALLAMRKQGISHLPLTDSNGAINSMISNKEIIQIQQYSAGLLIQEISGSSNIDELVEKSVSLPQVVKGLIDSGVKIATVTRIISSVADAVARKCIQFALDELGPAPCKFTFLILGSQGREEQTFATDQDNAILYENTDQPVQAYFLQLADKVNGWLHQAGYRFCKGEVMAKNPNWCISLQEWQANFSNWINAAEPQHLIDIGIFFDFRCLYGDCELVNQLRSHIHDELKTKAPFFNHLAKNSLLIKPPLNIMGHISKKSGEEQNGFDVKYALMPIIDFARIYALREHVAATNTLRRLKILFESDIINSNTWHEITECYEYLMMLRFKHQIEGLNKNRQPDNLINPDSLSTIEKHTLKKVLALTGAMQKKISFDFTGVAV